MHLPSQHHKDNQGWQHGSSGRTCAYQAQDYAFKPQYHKKKKMLWLGA
jgi:hypothetical protein